MAPPPLAHSYILHTTHDRRLSCLPPLSLTSQPPGRYGEFRILDFVDRQQLARIAEMERVVGVGLKLPVKVLNVLLRSLEEF
jgi:hypothetical protein